MHTETRSIEKDGPPYTIAEIGLNHNGDLSLACRMAEVAAKAGASAAKFQLFQSDAFFDPQSALGDGPPGSLCDYFRTFELQREEWYQLAEFVRSLRIDFLCSIFDSESLRLYLELDGRIIKVASGDISNFILLDEIAEAGRPALISVGTATEDEVKTCIERLQTHISVAPLLCVSSYPARTDEYALGALPAWAAKYGPVYGISDHSPENAACFAAAALGATIFEKHFTIDKTLPGPDQSLSLDPIEFQELTEGVAAIQRGMQQRSKICLQSEMPAKYGGRRSLYAKRDRKAGELLRKEDLIALRPAGGISPDRYDALVGRKLKRHINKNEQIDFKMLE